MFFSVIQSLNDGKRISTRSRTRRLGQIYDMAIAGFLGAMSDDGLLEGELRNVLGECILYEHTPITVT
jgi:hypothetical protein